MDRDDIAGSSNAAGLDTLVNETETKAEIFQDTKVTKESMEQLELNDNVPAEQNVEVASGSSNEDNCSGVSTAIEDEEQKLLPVISQYLSIVVNEKETRKQSALLKDEHISQFLVLSLMNESTKVISAAMDVFEILLSTRRNHPALQKLPYFLKTLEKIARNKKKYDVEMRRDALNMLRALNDSKQPLSDQSVPNRNAENVSKGPASMAPIKSATLTRAKQRGRETILQVAPGVLQHDQNRVMIERTLIKVNGIISLTFNLAKNQCVIRGKHNVGSEVFGIPVANLGLEVSVIYKNNLQEDVVVPISGDEKENSKENLPDYLPEEDDENTSVADNAICKQNSHAENPKQGSILNSAFSFVRNSFYW